MTATDAEDPARTESTQPGAADEVEQHRMTLGEHLDELRVRLMRAFIAVTIVFIAAWSFRDRVVDFSLAPYETKARVWLNDELYVRRTAELAELEAELLAAVDPEDAAAVANAEASIVEERLKRFDGGKVGRDTMREPIPTMRGDDGVSTFFYYMKVCGYAALFIAGPYVLWQAWAFVAAGLYLREKRVAYRFFPVSLGLFLGGVSFGYAYMVPYGYYYLTELGLNQIRHEALITPWISFLTTLLFGMGVVFQLPLVMTAFSRLDLIDPSDYGKYRGHFWIGALVLAAFFTPPDPYTQAMMAIPMAILYEVGILMAKAAHKRSAEGAELPVVS